ncbi:MAG: CopG family transcriptional regulator [Nitrososphaerota archaeon]|nr:CopG family transcriptional regulator [Nitrososphaerota archaeon]MDG6976100.1 CopG family transcriptional regulator [Nitrososphaerota archaeon]
MDEPAKKTLTIASPLYELLSARLGSSGASSVDELAAMIIRDWLSQEGVAKGESSESHREDEEVVKERLRQLGYL